MGRTMESPDLSSVLISFLKLVMHIKLPKVLKRLYPLFL